MASRTVEVKALTISSTNQLVSIDLPNSKKMCEPKKQKSYEAGNTLKMYENVITCIAVLWSQWLPYMILWYKILPRCHPQLSMRDHQSATKRLWIALSWDFNCLIRMTWSPTIQEPIHQARSFPNMQQMEAVQQVNGILLFRACEGLDMLKYAKTISRMGFAQGSTQVPIFVTC